MGETFQAGTWGVDLEVNLFHAMRSHKPVGVNRHFHMVVIHDKLIAPTTKKLTARNVWDHLSTMYDLQALNESEILPFPNKVVDFKLPDRDYARLCDDDFPRLQNAGTALAPEEIKVKTEGQAKGGKSSRADSKTSDSKKSDSRSSSASDKSSHSSKSESKSSSSSSGRGEGKGGGKGGHSVSSHSSSSTPDPSPKRTKRTRHNQSATSSPASDAPPPKRRR